MKADRDEAFKARIASGISIARSNRETVDLAVAAGSQIHGFKSAIFVARPGGWLCAIFWVACRAVAL